MKQWYSLGELSATLKVNKSKLYYYYKRGLFSPAMKAGGVLLFRQGDVTDALKKVAKLKKEYKTLSDFKK